MNLRHPMRKHTFERTNKQMTAIYRGRDLELKEAGVALVHTNTLKFSIDFA